MKYLLWNITDVIMKANKVIPENLVAVSELWEIYLYKAMEQPITRVFEDCDWLLHRFTEVNFSTLMDSNQIFRNDFVCFCCHLCKISTEINECKIFSPYDFQKWTLYNTISTLWWYTLQDTDVLVRMLEVLSHDYTPPVNIREQKTKNTIYWKMLVIFLWKFHRVFIEMCGRCCPSFN